MNVIIKPKYMENIQTDIADIKLKLAKIAHIRSMHIVDKKPILLDLWALA